MDCFLHTTFLSLFASIHTTPFPIITMRSWFHSLFMYFFSPSPQQQLQYIQQLQLAKQQLEAIQYSKEALTDAYAHFEKKLNELKDRKENLEEDRLNDLIECETRSQQEYLETLEEELHALDDKIRLYEGKLLKMKENILFLENSEKRTGGYIDLLYEQVRQSCQDGETIEWNRDEYDLGDLTVDSIVNQHDTSYIAASAEDTSSTVQSATEPESRGRSSSMKASLIHNERTGRLPDDEEDRSVSNTLDALQV